MTVSEKHIAAAIDLVDSEMFKGLMAVDRIGKCAEMVAAAMAEGEARETANLISIIADIRQKSGVGAKPMLGELADAIEARIAAAEREGMMRAAEVVQALPTCELTSVSPSGGVTPKMAFGIGAGAQREASFKAILSQANSHSVALLPPGATEAGSVQPSADPATHHASRNGEGA